MSAVAKTEKPRLPELRFPEFEGAWGEKRLGDIAVFASGGTPSKEVPEFWGGHIPWISAATLHADHVSVVM